MKPWTAEEKQFVADNYGVMQTWMIAWKLGRSEGMVLRQHYNSIKNAKNKKVQNVS